MRHTCGQISFTAPAGWVPLSRPFLCKQCHSANAIDNATANDLKLLKEQYRIQSILDLRSEVESGLQQKDMAMTFPAAVAHDIDMHEAIRHLHHASPATKETQENKSDQGSVCSSCSDARSIRADSVLGDIAAEAPKEATDQSSQYSTAASMATTEESVSIDPALHRRTYHVNFAGHKFRRHGIWKPLPFTSKL